MCGHGPSDIYIYNIIYRKFSPVARLGGLAPARPIITGGMTPTARAADQSPKS